MVFPGWQAGGNLDYIYMNGRGRNSVTAFRLFGDRAFLGTEEFVRAAAVLK